MVDVFYHLGDVPCFDGLGIERKYDSSRIGQASLDITLCISIDVGLETSICIEIFIDDEDDEICIGVSCIGECIGWQSWQKTLYNHSTDIDGQYDIYFGLMDIVSYRCS